MIERQETTSNKRAQQEVKYLPGFFWAWWILNSSFNLTGWDPGIITVNDERSRVKGQGKREIMSLSGLVKTPQAD